MAGDESTIGALLDETSGSIKTGPFGTKLKASEYTATGVPVISVGEVGFGRLRIHDNTPRVDETVSSRMPEFLLKAGDIVFGRKGAVERSAQVQPEEDGYFLGSDGIRIRLNTESCDPKFIAYQLQTTAHRSWMIQHAAGTTMPSLNEGIIRRIPIILRPLAEQKAIASVLGALDDKIELNRRMNATLESMARALFQSWFVDFDPVRAKLDGRQPVGMDAKTAEMLPNVLENSNQGIVPAGWRFVPLTDMYEIRSGLSKPRAEFGFGYPFLTFTNVMNNSFIPQTLIALVNSSDSERNECSVRRGDVFLTRTSETQEELGMSCVALDDYLLATFNGFTKRLRPKEDSPLGPEYSGFYFRSAKFRRDVTAMSSLSTRASLNNDMLAMLTILVPPKLVCDSFADYVCPLLRKVQANSQESELLATLRDTLLPKILSGELRATDMDLLVGHNAVVAER